MAEVLHHAIPFQFHMGLDTEYSEQSYLDKSEDGGKLYLKGIASDTLPDKQNQRFSKQFIESMVESADGMTCFYEHRRDLDNTIGVCKTAEMVDESLYVAIELEDPENNELVKKLIDKSRQGIKIGLSVSGVVTKSSIEKKDSAGEQVRSTKEVPIQILEEGRLDEISAVGLPSNPRGWASVIMKSFKDGVQGNMSEAIQKDLSPEQYEEARKAEEDDKTPSGENRQKDPSPDNKEEAPSKEDMLTMSREIVEGISEAIGGSIKALNDSMSSLREVMEASKKEVKESIANLTDGVAFSEKSQYERQENISRSSADRITNDVRNHMESTQRAAFDRTQDLITKSLEQQANILQKQNERLEAMEKALDIREQEFRTQVSEAVQEAVDKLTQNPTVAETTRKSQGNQEFNNVETHQNEARIFKNTDGELVVKDESIDPLTLNDAELSALDNDQKLDALNQGFARLMGI
tara:strand:+ start:2512 stop:3906 length:1395 start_codon:yes stop_codon:yes gene_type:complete